MVCAALGILACGNDENAKKIEQAGGIQVIRWKLFDALVLALLRAHVTRVEACPRHRALQRVPGD